MMEFTCEESPWELALDAMKPHGTMTALRFLTLTEDMDEDGVEDAFAQLEERHVTLDLSDLQIGSYLTSDYTEVFKTWEVHEIVRQNLGLDYTREELSGMLTISNPGDTRVLYITIENTDPEEAALLANEYATVAKQYISATMRTDEPSQFSEALVPQYPVSPRKALNVILGFALGTLAVSAFFVVQFLLDDKIKTADDIRRYTGLPTLAVVPDNEEALKAAPRPTAETKSADRRRKA